ncbi:MAG: enoyl-CoA hydratase-related protein [Actinomycetota bacterium]|nr:enoyl-CoA hydratase-related protein [Actinomycetota bacterium]
MELASLRKEGHVSIVTLQRPDALNAISGAMAGELATLFEQVTEDPDTWVMVLRAEGEKAFCVGADLKERAGFTLAQFHDNRAQVRRLFTALREVPQPTIAAVFGFALGGGFELALSCDLIVAAEGTKLGLPEARVGLLPAGGGTQLLTRKVGIARSKELIFRSRRLDATEAQQLGLVADVVPRAELDERARSVADDLCKASPVALREAKRSIDAALGVPLDDGIEIEHASWRVVIESDDRAEGIAAFAEKRDPRWQNR